MKRILLMIMMMVSIGIFAEGNVLNNTKREVDKEDENPETSINKIGKENITKNNDKLGESKGGQKPNENSSKKERKIVQENCELIIEISKKEYCIKYENEPINLSDIPEISFKDRKPQDFTIKSKNENNISYFIAMIKIYLNGELIYIWYGDGKDDGILKIKGIDLKRMYVPHLADLDFRIMPASKNIDINDFIEDIDVGASNNKILNYIKKVEDKIEDKIKGKIKNFKRCNEEYLGDSKIKKYRDLYCDLAKLKAQVNDVKYSKLNISKIKKTLSLLKRSKVIFEELSDKENLKNEISEVERSLSDYSKLFLKYSDSKERIKLFENIVKSLPKENEIFPTRKKNPYLLPEELVFKMKYEDIFQVYYFIPWNGVVYNWEDKKIDFNKENIIPIIDIIGVRFQNSTEFDFKFGLGLGLIKNSINKDTIKVNMILSLALSKFKVGLGFPFIKDDSKNDYEDNISMIIGVDLLDFLYKENIWQD